MTHVKLLVDVTALAWLPQRDSHGWVDRGKSGSMGHAHAQKLAILRWGDLDVAAVVC